MAFSVDIGGHHFQQLVKYEVNKVSLLIYFFKFRHNYQLCCAVAVNFLIWEKVTTSQHLTLELSGNATEIWMPHNPLIMATDIPSQQVLSHCCMKDHGNSRPDTVTGKASENLITTYSQNCGWWGITAIHMISMISISTYSFWSLSLQPHCPKHGDTHTPISLVVLQGCNQEILQFWKLFTYVTITTICIYSY